MNAWQRAFASTAGPLTTSRVNALLLLPTIPGNFALRIGTIPSSYPAVVQTEFHHRTQSNVTPHRVSVIRHLRILRFKLPSGTSPAGDVTLTTRFVKRCSIIGLETADGLRSFALPGVATYATSGFSGQYNGILEPATLVYGPRDHIRAYRFSRRV
ncbi:Protein of unknown function [Pyronema omphalodes CBS 100304]|uniref:Uncharacterized protein n=1 Tax=Pyronema omphalodes (strain CBS 100304) TaxID=1076935 RepID=U4LDV0_PYROM|nr:Protein of unknown function [Pyronema omphalodes CBS 100304]